jgi:predicted AlkP superfamily phosphohydrolase/phosphomutase
MTQRGRVLLVGLDACDPDIARNLAATGRMPALGRLLDRAARCKVNNPYGVFVNALWLSFATGYRADRHQFHCWDEIDVPSYERRLTPPPACQEHSFWNSLSDAGRRVAILDVPHSRVTAPLNGVQVVEWGCHDRHFGSHTWPPQRAAEIDAGIGLHPILGIGACSTIELSADDYVHRSGQLRTQEEEVDLLAGLLRGVDAKRKLNAALFAEGPWDLFLTVFGESHAIGHQQWHLHDPEHPRFDAEVVRAVGGDPLAQLYGRLDSGLGDMLAQIDADTTVLVLLSHGMGPHYDGTHLLDGVLRRLDRFHRKYADRRSAKRPLRRAMGSLPPGLQRRITAFAAPAIRRLHSARGLVACPEHAAPRERARQRYYMEPNNSVIAGIRLNVAGREPNGCVRPDEIDALSRQLSDDLLALVNVDTGGPVVRRLQPSDRWYRRSATDTFPDLFVEWERSGPVETVWSPKTGLVHAPYTNWRSGDHLPDGLLLALGPGIPAGAALSALDMEDLAPSIAARLGLSLGDVDGHPAAWLARTG